MEASMWWLLLACRGEPEPTDTSRDTDVADTDTDPLVPDDWGVVDGCDAARSDGFGDWYDAGSAVLVHGTTPEDLALAEQVVAWYSEWVDLELVAGDAVTDEQLRQTLWVLGAPATNPLLQEMNGSLPVWFEEDEFVFGGYRYQEPGNGIALVHPSPFADDRLILVFAGNTWDGAYSLFTIPTGGYDFETTRGRGVLQQEGALCHEDEVWGFVDDWAKDDRAGWDAFVETLDVTEGDWHTFYYVPGGEADGDMDWFADWQDDQYELAIDALGVEPLDHPIRTYLYPDSATKADVTGYAGNGHANDLNLEVHEIYGDGIYAVGAHEDVHVIAWHRIGDTDYALMGEGLAVMVGGEWWGEDLEIWASQFEADGTLPPLADLIDDFWSFDDTTTYPAAGHFVRFLRDTWGMDVVKRLYVAADLHAAFEDELGMTTAELEQAWHEAIP